jgi:hypothetical protein
MQIGIVGKLAFSPHLILPQFSLFSGQNSANMHLLKNSMGILRLIHKKSNQNSSNFTTSQFSLFSGQNSANMHLLKNLMGICFSVQLIFWSEFC